MEIIFVRRHIPESQGWLMTHGREEEAERTVDEIERRVEAEGVHLEEVSKDKTITVQAVENIPFLTIARVLFKDYPTRITLGLTMMITQSFLYNAIFFTYALVLTNFYGVEQTAVYFFPFAIGNLLGPIVLGHLFDSWGRRQMICFTYVVSGVVLGISAILFNMGVLDAVW